MELFLNGGAYCPSENGGLRTVSGPDELMQRVLMKLMCRAGGLACMPDYGSRLYTLPSLKPSQRKAAAESFISEALSGETELTLTDMELSDDGQGKLTIDLYFDRKGQSLSASLSI